MLRPRTPQHWQHMYSKRCCRERHQVRYSPCQVAAAAAKTSLTGYRPPMPKSPGLFRHCAPSNVSSASSAKTQHWLKLCLKHSHLSSQGIYLSRADAAILVMRSSGHVRRNLQAGGFPIKSTCNFEFYCNCNISYTEHRDTDEVHIATCENASYF